MNFTTRNIAATTASISGTGTICAEPTGALAISRRRLSALLLPAAICLAAAAPPAEANLLVSVTGLRSAKGQVMICLTRRTQKQFLKCDQDPVRITRIVKANAAQRLDFPGMVPGDYSLLLIHDENGNGRLDTMLGVPKEGFGFSRNPALR